MKYTNEGLPKSWDGKDWQTYKWVMWTVFMEHGLLDIVEKRVKRDELSTAEAIQDYDKKQIMAMRMIGTTIPSDTLQQIRDNDSGPAMWAALCELYENKLNKTVKVHTIRRIVNELWEMRLEPGGDANLHLCKMFNKRTELADLQYEVDDIDMVEMLLTSLPEQPEFESLKSSVRYGGDVSVYTPDRVRDLIRAASAREVELRGKRSQGVRSDRKNNVSEKVRKGERKYDKAEGFRKPWRCFVCNSEDHIKADCPEKGQKKAGGGTGNAKVTNEQKRTPRGNCTLRWENSASTRPESVGANAVQGQGMLTGALETSEQGTGDKSRKISEDAIKGWWYFDTASNAHVAGDMAYFVHLDENAQNAGNVHGVSPELATRVAGIGTASFVSDVDGDKVQVFLEDVLYVPGAQYGLLSPCKRLSETASNTARTLALEEEDLRGTWQKCN